MFYYKKERIWIWKESNLKIGNVAPGCHHLKFTWAVRAQEFTSSNNCRFLVEFKVVISDTGFKPFKRRLFYSAEVEILNEALKRVDLTRNFSDFSSSSNDLAPNSNFMPSSITASYSTSSESSILVLAHLFICWWCGSDWNKSEIWLTWLYILAPNSSFMQSLINIDQLS